VLAVEPIPSNATRLRRHIELNDLNHVTIANVGLGPQPGRGKALLPVNHAHDTAYARVSVADGGGDLEIVRLDQLWHDLGSFPVAAIKIDVEGAELDVLAGAYELLRHEGPSLLIEALDDAALAQLTTFLATMDYVRSESFKNLTPFDHVFLRADVV
jgi:FkbM family methyltransferase